MLLSIISSLGTLTSSIYQPKLSKPMLCYIVICSIVQFLLKVLVTNLWFEYASSVWDPHTNLNIQKLESIQRRAARFCYNNFSRYCSVTSLLTSLDLPSLQSRRKKAKLITMYKSINGYLCIPTNQLIPSYPNLRRGYYKQSSTRTDSYKFSFIPSTSLSSYGIPFPFL